MSEISFSIGQWITMSYINQCNNNLFFSLNFFFWLLPTTYTMRFALILCSLPSFTSCAIHFQWCPKLCDFFLFFLLFVISFISTPSLLDFNLNAIDWCRHIWILNTLLDKLAAMKWAKKIDILLWNQICSVERSSIEELAASAL